MLRKTVHAIKLLTLCSIFAVNVQAGEGLQYVLTCPQPQEIKKEGCMVGEVCDISANVWAKKYKGEGPNELLVVLHGQQLKNIQPDAKVSAESMMGCTYTNKDMSYFTAKLNNFKPGFELAKCQPMVGSDAKFLCDAAN